MSNLFEMVDDIVRIHKQGMETGFKQAELKYKFKIAQLEDEIRELNEELRKVVYKRENES